MALREPHRMKDFSLRKFGSKEKESKMKVGDLVTLSSYAKNSNDLSAWNERFTPQSHSWLVLWCERIRENPSISDRGLQKMKAHTIMSTGSTRMVRRVGGEVRHTTVKMPIFSATI